MLTNKDLYVYKHSPNQWAMELFDLHENLHWLPEEVPLQDDIRNWSEQPEEFLRHIMLFFVQADVEVGNTYIDEYIPHYKDLPIRMMLTSFAARESIHVKAYAHLVDTLNLGDGTYSAFLDDEVLYKLHKRMDFYRENAEGITGRYRGMVANTLLGEGVMLFGQFAMLLNYQRHNRFSGMGTLVAWSIRDEDLHVQGIAKLMKVDPQFSALPLRVKQQIYREVYDDLMPLIKTFARNCFNHGKPEGITIEEVEQFLEFQAQRRARQANIQEDEISVVNPFLWFDQLIGGVEHSNFFERRATEYSKNNLVGEYTYD